MDCEQLERNWIKAARKALGRSGARNGRHAAGSPAYLTGGDRYGSPGGPLPLSSFVEAYHDYHDHHV